MGRKKRSKKFWIIGLVLVIVVVVIVAGVGGSNGEKTLIQADLAYIDSISEMVTASGRIQPQTKVDITAEVSAQIIGVFVREGNAVKRGQHLILLDTIQLQADAAQARYSLDEITARTEAARAQFEKDKLEFERQSRLYERQLISETAYINAKFAYENARANYDAMLAQVKTGRARLDKAEDNLTKTSIDAPMDGIVIFLNAEVGEIAQAQTSYTQGQRLMTIADLSVFEVEVGVDETEIAKVRVGQPASIRIDAFRDTSFAGTVVEIGNSARIEGQGSEDYSTNFTVKIRCQETDAAIRPGMSASVDIITSSMAGALLVPYAAVVAREFDPDSLTTRTDDSAATADDGLMAAPLDSTATDTDTDTAAHVSRKKKVRKTGLFLVRNGSAEFVEITTGIADETNIVALSGVQPGDTVVSGSFKTLRGLSDGDAVRIEDNSLEKMREYE